METVGSLLFDEKSRKWKPLPHMMHQYFSSIKASLISKAGSKALIIGRAGVFWCLSSCIHENHTGCSERAVDENVVVRRFLLITVGRRS